MEYPAGDAGITPASDDDAAYSTLMLAALMIGHHFAIGDLGGEPSAWGFWSGWGKIPGQSAASWARTAGSARASTTTALSLAAIGAGTPLGSKSPCHNETWYPGSPASSAVGMS